MGAQFGDVVQRSFARHHHLQLLKDYSSCRRELQNHENKRQTSKNPAHNFTSMTPNMSQTVQEKSVFEPSVARRCPRIQKWHGNTGHSIQHTVITFSPPLAVVPSTGSHRYLNGGTVFSHEAQ